MLYKVFYFFERSGESVSSANAIEMSAGEIRKQLLGCCRGSDDFLGIIDDRENVLQIFCEPDQERFWIELPIEAARASYGRHLPRAELEALLEQLPPVFDQEHIPGLSYKPW